MTDKSRAAFEAWYRSDEDKDLTDNAPSIDDLDAHHKYWMLAAWEASRKQTLAEPEQPARVPLPIEKIEACMKRAYAAAAGSRNLEICFAREIESEHGIKPLSFGPYDPEDDHK